MSTKAFDWLKPTSGLVRRSFSGETMGTRYSVVYFASSNIIADSLERDAFEAVDAVDRQMSNWKPGSDLNRLNAAPVGQWIDVPAQFCSVLAIAIDIGRASDSAFDISVGDRVAAWGFGPHASEKANGVTPRGIWLPAHSALQMRERAVFKHAPIVADLNGIAKGFAVDELARILLAHGVTSWLVGIDGEMRAAGRKPNGEPWSVGHERPDRERRDIMGVIELEDMAVATSGNYRHWASIGGRIVSHTIAPRTGNPVDNNIASVTVLAKTCVEADAWATALLVQGEEDGTRSAKRAGLDAIFVRDDASIA